MVKSGSAQPQGCPPQQLPLCAGHLSILVTSLSTQFHWQLVSVLQYIRQAHQSKHPCSCRHLRHEAHESFESNSHAPKHLKSVLQTG